WDGSRLASEQDVIVVSLNHRLNIFGYLCLAELGGRKYADSGNAGMLDIVLALEWVRDNIGVFGGDPSNVTIFGDSGGGQKVIVLMGMPAAKGLFHKAIVQSGPYLRAIARDDATAVSERVLSYLNLKSNQIDQLQSISAKALLEAWDAITGQSASPPWLSD